MNCETCRERKPQEPVPYRVHTEDMARLERANRRLWIVLILVIVLLCATNAAWIWYESQFEDVVITQENEDGYNSYIGNDGDIYNYGQTNDSETNP